MNLQTPIRNLDMLQRDFQEQVSMWLSECYKQGIKIKVSETWRSQARQEYLYEQGRTRSGKVVTWTLDSTHTQGLAVDIYFDEPTIYPPKSDPRWRQVADIAKTFGIDWGFDLWGFDYPHFQDNKAVWEKPPSDYGYDGFPILNTKKKITNLMKSLPRLIWTRPRKGALGTYNKWSNTIKIEPEISSETHEYILEHEWAHFIWHHRMSERARGVYKRSFERTGYSPTAYGKTNASENFAEVYAQLIEGRIPYEHTRYAHRAALNAMQRFEELNRQSIYSQFMDLFGLGK